MITKKLKPLIATRTGVNTALKALNFRKAKYLSNASFTHFFLGMVLVAILPLACKDKFCEVTNSQSGIILRPMAMQGNCMALDTLTQFVINSEAEWKHLVDSSCVLSRIDFTTETLIGMRTTGQCDMGYAREVTRFDSKKQYHYRVITSTCGHCERMEINFNLVVVPKLPADYTVTFELINNP